MKKPYLIHLILFCHKLINIEHIFVDGGSKDNTIKLLNKYPNPRKKIYIKKGYGIYKSINYGIKKSKGKYIAILNSDDIYESNSIISEIISTIKKSKNNKIILGNLTFKNFNYTKIRYYNIKNFNIDSRNMQLCQLILHQSSTKMFTKNMDYILRIIT